MKGKEERFEPIIVGSKLINSQFIDVVDVIEVECGRTLEGMLISRHFRVTQKTYVVVG